MAKEKSKFFWRACGDDLREFHAHGERCILATVMHMTKRRGELYRLAVCFRGNLRKTFESTTLPDFALGKEYVEANIEAWLDEECASDMDRRLADEQARAVQQADENRYIGVCLRLGLPPEITTEALEQLADRIDRLIAASDA